MSTVVYQLLEWKPDILRRRYQEFRMRLESEEWWNQTEEGIAMEIAVGLLCDVLREMKGTEMSFIALDRVDLCSWKLQELMSQLAKLVNERSLNVKIVASSQPPARWDIGGVEIGASGGRVFVCQGWDQRRL